MSGHTLRKRNRRLYVVDPQGREIYTPPDFVQLVSGRGDFNTLLSELDAGHNEIEAIAAFETRFTRKRRS